MNTEERDHVLNVLEDKIKKKNRKSSGLKEKQESEENLSEKKEISLLKIESGNLSNKMIKLEKEQENLVKGLLIGLTKKVNKLENAQEQFVKKSLIDLKISEIDETKQQCNTMKTKLDDEKQRLMTAVTDFEKRLKQIEQAVGKEADMTERLEEEVERHIQRKFLDIDERLNKTQLDIDVLEKNTRNFGISEETVRQLEIRFKNLDKNFNFIQNKVLGFEESRFDLEKLLDIASKKMNDIDTVTINKLDSVTKEVIRMQKTLEKEQIEINQKLEDFSDSIQKLQMVVRNRILDNYNTKKT